MMGGSGRYQGSDEPDNIQEERRLPIIQKLKRVPALPMETEIDLSGEFAFSKILNSLLADNKAVNKCHMGDFETNEDARMRNQFPDYDVIRVFDLPGGVELEAISHGISGNFDKPYCGTSKHHLEKSNSPAKLFRATAQNDKKCEFNQECMYGRVA